MKGLRRLCEADPQRLGGHTSSVNPGDDLTKQNWNRDRKKKKNKKRNEKKVKAKGSFALIASAYA
jgi:hypothetical protein